MFDRLIRLHWSVFAVTLGFASVVEWAHFRSFLARRQWFQVVCTAIAAIASGFMASESLTHDWPSWESINLHPKVDWNQVLQEVQSSGAS
jgi:hypothetical protein